MGKIHKKVKYIRVSKIAINASRKRCENQSFGSIVKKPPSLSVQMVFIPPTLNELPICLIPSISTE